MGRRWLIGVRRPLGAGWRECVEVPEVERSTFDLGGLRAGATFLLRDGTPRQAADRIADCIRGRLEAGDVSVHQVDWPPADVSGPHAV